jgi:hypothetical protein
MKLLRLRTGDIIAAILWALLVIAAGILVALPRTPTNGGFGPEWKCIRHYRGGPICIKSAP